MKELLIKLAYWLLKVANKKTVFFVKYEDQAPHYERGSGSTTRIIDALIQRLFEEDSITVIDHFATRQSNERVMYIILERLEREHGITKAMVDINRSQCTIKFKG